MKKNNKSQFDAENTGMSQLHDIINEYILFPQENITGKYWKKEKGQNGYTDKKQIFRNILNDCQTNQFGKNKENKDGYKTQA